MTRVRNIGAIGIDGKTRPKPIPIHIFIPPSFTAIQKIEVYDGTNAYDVTDYVIEGEYTDGVTETIGSFNFEIDNSAHQYTDKFSLYNQIRIYLDYGKTATTLRFVGMIERVSTKANNIVLTGTSSASRATGKNVTYQATDMSRSTLLTNIINKYFSGVITTTNISEDTGTMTVNYFDLPFWEIVEEICNSGGYDAYIDQDFDFHYISSGSVTNSTECIVHDINLISTGDFSPDLQEIANKVKVYGANINGLPIIATASDSTSQDSLGGDIKELKINDSNITTIEQAQARADYELSISKDPPTVGTITSLGLPTLSPGENVRITDPINNIKPDAYLVRYFTHKFSNDEPFMTEVTLQKIRSSLPTILKKRIKFENAISSENVNPREMDYSIIYNFNEERGSHSNTEIIKYNYDSSTGKYKDGHLMIISGTSGNWISNQITLDGDVDSLEIQLGGEDIGTDSVSTWVSLNGGTSWTETSVEGTFIVPEGKNLLIRLELISTNTKIKTVAFLYTLK